LIADAKIESEIILQDAEKEVESILAGAVEEAAEKTALVQEAEKKAASILAGALMEKTTLVQDAEEKAEAILAGAAEEKQKWEAEKTALAGVQQFEPIVKLNVGGVRVTTSLTTLRRFPDTMMGSMFSGRHTITPEEDGYFFIDRDGTHFRHILNFLRSPEGYTGYRVGVSGAEEQELRRECEYYCLDELMFPFTEKSLPYYRYDQRYHEQGQSQGSIIVKVDGAGVHTIRDRGEYPIQYCPRCHCGSFEIGKEIYFFSPFTTTQFPPAAQPKVQGICPRCCQQV
jgi:hypothetical protein